MDFKDGLINHMNKYMQEINNNDTCICAEYLIGLIEMKNVVFDYLMKTNIDINQK